MNPRKYSSTVNNEKSTQTTHHDPSDIRDTRAPGFQNQSWITPRNGFVDGPLDRTSNKKSTNMSYPQTSVESKHCAFSSPSAQHVFSTLSCVLQRSLTNCIVVTGSTWHEASRAHHIGWASQRKWCQLCVVAADLNVTALEACNNKAQQFSSVGPVHVATLLGNTNQGTEFGRAMKKRQFIWSLVVLDVICDTSSFRLIYVFCDIFSRIVGMFFKGESFVYHTLQARAHLHHPNLHISVAWIPTPKPPQKHTR